jgi:hypothetical protein
MSFATAIELAQYTTSDEIKDIALQIAKDYITKTLTLSDIGFSPVIYYDGKINPHNRLLTEKTFGTDIYYILVRKTISLMDKKLIPTADHLGILNPDNTFNGQNTDEFVTDLEREYIKTITLGTIKVPHFVVRSRIGKEEWPTYTTTV